MTVIIINGRIYSPDEVNLDKDVIISDDRYIEVGDSSHIKAKRISAQNNLVSAAFIDISMDITEKADALDIYNTLSYAQKSSSRHGVSDIYPIIGLDNVSSFLNIIKANSRLSFLAGFRLFLGPTVPPDSVNLQKALDLITSSTPKCIDIIIPASAGLSIRQRNALRKTGCKICLQVETSDELGQIEFDDVDCVSVPFDLVSIITKFHCWVELRLPSPNDLKFIPIGDPSVDNIIVRGYWKGLANTQLSQKQQLFFTNRRDLLYMAQNQVVRFLNRGMGLPLHKSLAICTYNHGKYVGLEYDNVINTGTKAHAIIMDGKLDITDYL